MALSEQPSRQIFVVRIWREPREISDAWPEWRGSVECVRTGEQHYLKNLDEVAAFIKPYLVQMGVKIESETPR